MSHTGDTASLTRSAIGGENILNTFESGGMERGLNCVPAKSSRRSSAIAQGSHSAALANDFDLVCLSNSGLAISLH